MQGLVSMAIGFFIFLGAYLSPLVALIVIISCITNLFGIVNPDAIVKSGQYNIVDVALVATVAVFVKIVIVQKGYRYLFGRKTFSGNILAFLALVLVWILVPYVLYGQPLMMGLRAARRFLLVLLYFPFTVFFRQEDDRQNFIKTLRLMALLIASLYLAQFLLIGKIVFLYLRLSERYGGVRLHIYGMGLIIAGLILVFNELFHKRYRTPAFFYLDKMRLLFQCALLLFVVVFISKARTNLVGIAAIFTVILFTSRRINLLQKILIVFFLGVGFMGLIFSNAFDPLVLLFNNELFAENSNITIRFQALNYYWDLYRRTPLFGMGIQNLLYPNNPLNAGFGAGYMLVDIG
ncbi:MAG TPA: O-antigen ligase family protein, partial [Bacillota bacterium]|nr:O-antigen ligase family protein [Bacillota bacterium]